MNRPPHSRKEMEKERYDMKRERDVLLLYGAAFRDIPHIDDHGTGAEQHVPRPSPDSMLTALCQLTAIRLGCQRSIISLLDDHRQHILAEATCDLSLRPEAPGDAPSTLWLGNVSIPRNWGLCEQVLELDPKEKPVLIIEDLANDNRSCYRQDVKHNSDMRFYASAALLSPAGAIVGTLCIFDKTPRDGLSKEEVVLLKDLATTVVDYLNTYTIKDQYRRGERFTRGLVSFAEGASALLPFEKNQHDSSVPSETFSDLSTTDKEVASAEDAEDAKHAKDPKVIKNVTETTQTLPHQPPKIASTSNRAKSARHRSIRTLQESILPTNSKSMFSRAANVMMASSDLDGVLILDASVAANGQHRAPHSSRSGTDTASESYQSRSSSSDEGSSVSTRTTSGGMSASSSKMCQVLGVAIPDSGVNTEYGTLLEPDLARLFHGYSHGKVFTFTGGGLSLSSTEEGSGSPSAGVLESMASEESPKRKTKSQSRRGSSVVRAMFPGARSVAFIPFWDYERSRWFAGCLCWSNNPYRLLSASVDLAYFKIFSHSIMRELSKLDAVSSNQVGTSNTALDTYEELRVPSQLPTKFWEAKTTFVASISHELRSPLHGILGTLEFIKDTPLDSFQTSMLNSLSACGTTLLDTINHVMDYSKISEARKGISSRRLKNSNTIRLSSKPLKSPRNKDPGFDFGIATEEVVEAVFSGSSYMTVASKLMEAPPSPSEETSNSFPKRKTCFIVLDLAFEEDWVYCFPVGSWRRIVMNLVGNSIKYTGSGFIDVSLRIGSRAENTDVPTAITLTITDSGLGMSPTFLANKAFQPFSQENSHAAGTGLGLSIVRQIIDTNGGKIEASSDPSLGTKLTVKLALTKPDASKELSPQRTQFLSFLPRLEGRRICILHKKITPLSENPNMSRADEGLVRFTNALATTLEKHLKMNVVRTANWEGHDAELVILPEPSFNYLAAIRRNRIENKPAPITVFVAMDALEAATLRSDVRVTNRESVVEIMTQPCGPYKLAFILNTCLDRFEHPSENLEHSRSATPSSQASLYEVQRLQEASPLLRSLPTPSSETNPPTPPPSATTTSAESMVAERVATLALEEEPVVSHILITDDNLINRRLLVAFMKKQGLQYQEAVNGLEALLAYQEGTRKFDVILMDMSMPVMDGMSATRAIREYEQSQHMPRCSIIALTGLASASAKLEAWSSGIDHFMTKPINFKALDELLKKEGRRRQERRKDKGRVEEDYDCDVEDDAVDDAVP